MHLGNKIWRTLTWEEWHLLPQIDLNVNFSSFSRLLSLKESSVNQMGKNIPQSVVRCV